MGGTSGRTGAVRIAGGRDMVGVILRRVVVGVARERRGVERVLFSLLKRGIEVRVASRIEVRVIRISGAMGWRYSVLRNIIV